MDNGSLRYNSIGNRYLARLVTSEGLANHASLTNTFSVRPAFYLTSDVEIIGGTGTIDDPFLIN